LLEISTMHPNTKMSNIAKVHIKYTQSIADENCTLVALTCTEGLCTIVYVEKSALSFALESSSQIKNHDIPRL
jgi:hypothetical protein